MVVTDSSHICIILFLKIGSNHPTTHTLPRWLSPSQMILTFPLCDVTGARPLVCVELLWERGESTEWQAYMLYASVGPASHIAHVAHYAEYKLSKHPSKESSKTAIQVTNAQIKYIITSGINVLLKCIGP